MGTRLAIDFQIRRCLTTLIDIRKQLNFPRIPLFYLTVRSYPSSSIPSRALSSSLFPQECQPSFERKISFKPRSPLGT